MAVLRQIRPWQAACIAGCLAAALAWSFAAALEALLPPGRDAWDPGLGLTRLGALARLASRNQADFESGNIGRAERTGPYEYALELRSDNDDALPHYWRQWFYLRLDRVPTDRPVTLTLTGAGQTSYYLPFFSYDDHRWTQFAPRDVTQPTKDSLRMTRRFRKSTVWLARYVPYTYTTLMDFLQKLRRHPDVLITDVGRSPEGRPVPLVTITDAQARGPKARVVIHARTHPGEVGSSFLLEGLLQALVAPTPLARRLRQHLIFTVLPMLNVDGVASGNNRVSPEGVNLEGKWQPGEDGSFVLDREKTPSEVKVFHDHLLALLRGSVPVTMALNLHASAGDPEDAVFVFPHFGSEGRGYSPTEASLYGKQLAFIDSLRQIQGKGWFRTPAEDGTRGFLASWVPETWWWRSFGDKVMALTLESTYGYAGRSHRWVQPDDMRAVGASVARAIGRYHGLDGHDGPAPGGVELRRFGRAH